MNLLALLFHRTSKDPKLKRSGFAYLFRMSRKRMVAAAAILLILLFAGMLLCDGFIFYTYVMRPRESPSGKAKRIDLSEAKIVEILRLVNDRQKEFDSLLAPFGGAARATSSQSVLPSPPAADIRIRR